MVTRTGKTCDGELEHDQLVRLHGNPLNRRAIDAAEGLYTQDCSRCRLLHSSCNQPHGAGCQKLGAALPSRKITLNIGSPIASAFVPKPNPPASASQTKTGGRLNGIGKPT